MPSRSSSEAPPPVETWLMLLPRFIWLTAATESPPPTTEMHVPFFVASARAVAMPVVGGAWWCEDIFAFGAR